MTMPQQLHFENSIRGTQLQTEDLQRAELEHVNYLAIFKFF